MCVIMASYHAYWTIDNVRMAENTPNWSHACWGSNRENFPTMFEAGDVIYFSTIDEGGQHSLFSKLVLDRFTGTRDQTEPLIPFSLTNVPFDSYWMGKKPWSTLFDIPFKELALTLDFASGNKLPPDYTGQHLQSIRELTSDDVLAIEELIEAYIG